ncbi:MAG: ATP-dependent Clp protease ATP-binding subunit ClpX, partial [Oscillospiraceae bacterium]
AAAKKAVERGIGARGLRAVLEEVKTQVMYDVPDQPDIAKVTVTPDCVNDHAKPELTRDATRAPRPRLGAAALRAESGGLAKQGNVS